MILTFALALALGITLTLAVTLPSSLGEAKPKKVAKVELALPNNQGTLTLTGAADDFQRMEKIDLSQPSTKKLSSEVHCIMWMLG